MAYGTVNADTITTSSGAILGAGNASAMKNRIINGAMVIDQRNAGASVNPSSNYNLDRWAFYNSQSSKVTVQQNAGSVTPPAGFTNYLGVTSSSAYSINSTDYFELAQQIEGYNIADLAWGTSDAKAITISFWIRSSLTGTFGAVVGNISGTRRTYPFTYVINSANTWEYKTATIPGCTDGTWLTNSNCGIIIRFGLGIGSTYSTTAGSWATSNYDGVTGATSLVGTNGATWYITGVQLEVGSSATGFEYRQYTNELQLCQRYYQTTNTGLVSWTGNTSCFLGWNYSVPMRASASVGYTGGPYIRSQQSANSNLTGSLSFYETPGLTGATIAITVASGTNTGGYVGWLYSNGNPSSSFIYASAEL